jgi:hypothetical protein
MNGHSDAISRPLANGRRLAPGNRQATPHQARVRIFRDPHVTGNLSRHFSHGDSIMTIQTKRCANIFLVSLSATLLTAGTAHAQCKTGQQRQQSNSQQQLAQQTQRLNTLLGLQQPNSLFSSLQRQQQLALLLALQQQRQQNSLLIALQTKQQNGLLTATQSQQYLNAVQVALQQTQVLLTALQQQNAITNQNAWLDALQRQLSVLSDLSGQSSPQSSS